MVERNEYQLAMRWSEMRGSPRAVYCIVAVGMCLLASPAADAQAAAWSIVPTPNGADGNGILLAVSCTSADACDAVGWTHLNVPVQNLQNGALAADWDGTSWRSEPTPNPAGALTSALSGVSCTSRRNCEAVGYYISEAGTGVAGFTLAEHWDGSSWTIQPTPSPAGGFAALDGVSCTSARACIAVGTSNNSSLGPAQTLAERWNGRAWKLLTTPNPTGSQRVTLFGVSCTAPVRCAAVGQAGNFVNSELVPATLAERLRGSRWTIQPTPQRAGADSGSLLGVSCTSTIACIAVGDVDVLGAPLAERWDGRSWTVQSVPSSPGSTTDFVMGVACTSRINCTGAGSAGGEPLAEHWDGISWTVQSTVAPAGSGYTPLLGVSCRSPTFCAAVGYSSTPPPFVTLAEVYK